MAEINAYNEALSSGQYQKPGGLLGKYDNVRRFWEDEQLGLYLRPYLEQLIPQKSKHGKKLRVLDIGCGSGDGFELLNSINSTSISTDKTRVIQPDMLEIYKGIDINEGLLEQMQATYRDKHNMAFAISDYNDYDFSKDQPYDLYLANYGTLSHNTDEQTVELLSNIAKQSKGGALIIVDWLGRYAYEWQTLWTKDLEHNQWMDYIISYIYPGDKAKKQDLSSFPLRIVGRSEVLHIYQQAKKKSGGVIKLRKLADRSSFVGRHIDTAQYNPHCQPLRSLVNQLFEPNVCTDLDELLIHYVPSDGFDKVNAYHQRFANCWNYLVTSTKALLEGTQTPKALAETPLTLRRTLSAMKYVVRAAARMKIGNARASLVEPQLGYCLRELEMRLQKGLGCGHGLVAIFEIVK